MSTAVTKKQNGKAMTLAGSTDGFSDEEINEIESFSSYLNNFYKMRSDGTDLVIYDKAGNEFKRIAKGKKLSGFFIVWRHWVYRLMAGTVEGMKGDYKEWPDEMQKQVAKSYGSTHQNPKSRGNFDLMGHGEWLDDKERRKDVTKRCFYYLLAPDLLPDEIIVATFGASSNETFEAFSNSCKAMGAPVAYCAATLHLDDAKNPDNKAYQKPTFEFYKKAGQIQTAGSTPAAYKKHMQPIIDTVKAAYQDEAKAIENMNMSDDKVVDTSSGTNNSIESKIGKDDEIPF